MSVGRGRIVTWGAFGVEEDVCSINDATQALSPPARCFLCHVRYACLLADVE